MKVFVGVSARHIHLTKDTYMRLFGNDFLEKIRVLDQPTQFASSSVLTIRIGEKEIHNVRVLGPFREYDQVEISRTDAYKLNVNPPIKSSGDLEFSIPIILVGPLGEVNLDRGLILANRHIHITSNDVLKYGLDGVEKVCVKVDGEKGGVFKNVYLKVSDDAGLRLHLDTDDANAFGLVDGSEVEVLLERGNEK